MAKRAEVLQQRSDRPVLRLGRRVKRPRQPGSEAVHALLTHLEEVGFTAAPRPLRLSRRYEHQSYLSGVSGDAASRLVDTSEAVAQVGALLRRYHDAVDGWRPEQPLTWFDGQTGTGGPGQIVCHGDPGPWNLVWRRGRAVGLIDWEYATIGTRRTDIAYALHYLVPFRDRSYWQGVLGLRRRPRRHERMRAFAEGYGIDLDEGLVDAVLESQQAGVRLMVDLAAQGHPRYQRLLADGGLERERRAVLWGEGHRHRFLARAGAPRLPDLSAVRAIPEPQSTTRISLPV